MTVRAMLANPEGAAILQEAGVEARDVLDYLVCVVTMTGTDLSRIRAALTVLCDIGKAEIRNELMPLLSELNKVI